MEQMRILEGERRSIHSEVSPDVGMVTADNSGSELESPSLSYDLPIGPLD